MNAFRWSLAAACLLSLPALADAGDKLHQDSGSGSNPVNERRPLNPNGAIYVNELSGTVVVSGWDKNEVAVSGELNSSDDRLDISGDPAKLSVVVVSTYVRGAGGLHSSGGADLHLQVPSGAQVTVETVSGDASVNGTRGPVRISTVSGDVGLAVSAPRVTVQTVSGDVVLQGPSADTVANTVSGELRLSGLQGALQASTVSGNLELAGGKFSDLRLKSTSGEVHLDVSFADKAKLVAETLSGDINLLVPADLSGTGTLKSFSGEAICDKNPLPASNVRRGQKREYAWGDGKGVEMQLSSFSGDIHVDRKPAVSAR